MEKARRACEAIFLDEGLPQIIVEITSSNSNIYSEWNNPFWRALVHGKRACQVREGAVGNVITTSVVDNTRWPPTSFFSLVSHRQAHWIAHPNKVS